ncbi:MAG: hypothetical protein KGM24_03215 [Elusimicrobia bacterium]|nr:hypothetical protein [Elusimicrobiota bacterium]
MADPGPEAEELRLRKKRTLWLLAGGALSLLLPLLGALYLHWSQSEAVHGPSGRDDVFDRRDGAKLTPTQAVVVQPVYQTSPAAAAAGGTQKAPESSLDFIRPAAELKPPPASAGTAPAPKAAAAPKTARETAAKTKPAPENKKPAAAFVMPKLQPTRGFTSMQGFGQSAQPASQKPTPGQGQDMQEFLKHLPPGAQNDPRVQAYLKEHGAGQ